MHIISSIKVIKVTPRMSNGMYSSRQIVAYIARPESRIARTVMMEIIRTSHGKDKICLLAGALLNASDAAKDCVKMQTARRGIRRYKQGMVPPEPAMRRYLVFVGPWTTTGGDDPKPFLSHDSGQNVRDRIIVFATDESLRVLCRTNTWFMDGNFSLAPPVFDQLYVIRASLGTTCISCVYALLPGKSETVYTEMLEAVTDACTALVFSADPTTVVTDFEMTAMQAVTAGFGQQVHVQGCFFSACARVRGDVCRNSD